MVKVPADDVVHNSSDGSKRVSRCVSLSLLAVQKVGFQDLKEVSISPDLLAHMGAEPSTKTRAETHCVATITLATNGGG